MSKEENAELELVTDHVSWMADAMSNRNMIFQASRGMGKTQAARIAASKPANPEGIQSKHFRRAGREDGNNVYVVGLTRQHQMWLCLKNEKGLKLEESLMEDINAIRKEDPTAVFRTVIKDVFDEDLINHEDYIS